MLTHQAELGMMSGMARPRDTDPQQAAIAVAAWLDACRTSNTRAAYRSDLAQFAAWCAVDGEIDLLAVTADDVARYRAACEVTGAAPSTVARRLSAIASFGVFANNSGAAVESFAAGSRPVVEPRSTADALTDSDAEALLESADELGARHGALIRLLMLDGLKVGEVVAADADDVHGRAAELRLALGSRPREISLDRRTAGVLSKYLGRRRRGPLFLGESGGRARRRLTRFGVDYMVKQVARAARLAPTVSGNTLRRRYVIAAHADGVSLDDIRKNAGHVSERTTRRYLAHPVREEGGRTP
jgi:integrase/recombinase XerD